MSDIRCIEERLHALERRVSRLHTVMCILVLGAIGTTTLAAIVQAQDSKALRVRSLVVEDAAGRDRIVFGAPVPDPRPGRVSPSTGLVINDQQGVERFAVGLQANGRVVMGFDAPPGTGDPRNRERITLVADAAGGAYLRFLNRKTAVPGRLVLGDDDRFYVEFLDFRDGRTFIKRIGFKGEEVVESKP